MSGQPKLLFVYNADTGMFNLLADISHKIFSPHTYQCSLCAVTHDYFSEKEQWRKFVSNLPVGFKHLHRNEFHKLYPQNTTPLPAVFCQLGNELSVCLDSAALDDCSDIGELEEKIMQNCLCNSK